MKAIRVHETGGPEVLRLEDVADPIPAPGELLIDVEAVGVNFIEIYQREGLYPLPRPFTLGARSRGRRARDRRGRDGVQGRRPRRFAEREGRVRGASASSPPTARSVIPDGVSTQAGRGGLAAGADRALSRRRRPIPLAAGRSRARPRGGGRRRTSALPDGEEARRVRHRHGVDRREARSSRTTPAPTR